VKRKGQSSCFPAQRTANSTTNRQSRARMPRSAAKSRSAEPCRHPRIATENRCIRGKRCSGRAATTRRTKCAQRRNESTKSRIATNAKSKSRKPRWKKWKRKYKKSKCRPRIIQCQVLRILPVLALFSLKVVERFSNTSRRFA